MEHFSEAVFSHELTFVIWSNHDCRACLFYFIFLSLHTCWSFIIKSYNLRQSTIWNNKLYPPWGSEMQDAALLDLVLRADEGSEDILIHISRHQVLVCLLCLSDHRLLPLCMEQPVCECFINRPSVPTRCDSWIWVLIHCTWPCLPRSMPK